MAFGDSTDSDESLQEYANRRLIAKQLRSLDIIFGGKTDAYPLRQCLEDSPNSSKSQLVSGLITDYPDQLERFLHILDTDFGRSEISANDVVDYLGDHYGDEYQDVTKDRLEDVSSRPNLLIAVYYCMYDAQTGELSPDFRNLLASAKIYKQNTRTVYTVENERIPFPDLESNIVDFLGEWNTDGQRKAAIQEDIDIDEEQARLKLYREKMRTAEYVFEFRKQGKSNPITPSDPEVDYEDEYAVDTLGVEVQNAPFGVKIVLSGRESGWLNFLKPFTNQVLELDTGWDGLSEKSYPGASHVLNSARNTADNADSDDEADVVESVNSAMKAHADEVLESLRNDPDTSPEQVEEADEWLSSVVLSGYQVMKDTQTSVHRAGVRSQGRFEEAEEEVSSTGIVDYLQRTKDDTLCLFFQIVNPDTEERMEFKVYQGDWQTAGRGLESDAFHQVERLMEYES